MISESWLSVEVVHTAVVAIVCALCHPFVRFLPKSWRRKRYKSFINNGFEFPPSHFQRKIPRAYPFTSFVESCKYLHTCLKSFIQVDKCHQKYLPSHRGEELYTQDFQMQQFNVLISFYFCFYHWHMVQALFLVAFHLGFQLLVLHFGHLSTPR